MTAGKRDDVLDGWNQSRGDGGGDVGEEVLKGLLARKMAPVR